LFFWGGNHAAIRRPAGVYTHTYRAIKGARAGKQQYQLYSSLNLNGSMAYTVDRAI